MGEDCSGSIIRVSIADDLNICNDYDVGHDDMMIMMIMKRMEIDSGNKNDEDKMEEFRYKEMLI